MEASLFVNNITDEIGIRNMNAEGEPFNYLRTATPTLPRMGTGIPVPLRRVLSFTSANQQTRLRPGLSFSNLPKHHPLSQGAPDV